MADKKNISSSISGGGGAKKRPVSSSITSKTTGKPATPPTRPPTPPARPPARPATPPAVNHPKPTQSVSGSVPKQSPRPMTRPTVKPVGGLEERVKSTAKGQVQAVRPIQRPAPRSMPAVVPAGVAGGVAAAGAAANAAAAAHESKIAAMNSEWERLAGDATLADLYDRMEDITVATNALPDQIASLRARGFIYGRGWEEQAYALQEQWAGQYDDILKVLDDQRELMARSSDGVADLVARAQSNPQLLPTAESRLNDLGSRVSEAKRRVAGAFDKILDGLEALQNKMSDADEMLTALEGASFQCFPDERGYAFCEANWHARGTEPIPGMLFLTNSRLLFEQREKVATKKFLFITTQSEMVQKLLWFAPLGGVEVFGTEDKKAFLSKSEMITLRVEGGENTPPEITLELKGGVDNESWARLLKRAKEGQLDTERYDVVAPAPTPAPAEGESPAAPAPAAPASEPAKPLPTQCPSCNAKLPTIYKGMHQIACDYCGTVVNIE